MQGGQEGQGVWAILQVLMDLVAVFELVGGSGCGCLFYHLLLQRISKGGGKTSGIGAQRSARWRGRHKWLDELQLMRLPCEMYMHVHSCVHSDHTRAEVKEPEPDLQEHKPRFVQL